MIAVDTINANRCLACSSGRMFDFFAYPEIPINVGMLCASYEQAIRAQRGQLILANCENCGLVRNRAFNPDDIHFRPGYDASLVHSPVIWLASQHLASQLVERFDLDGKSVLDIGCGQAHFLRHLCTQASIRAVGIDPSAVASEESISDSHLRVIQDRLGEQHRDEIGDLITCISVLEDIANPESFLSSIRQMIGTRRSNLYFEVFRGFDAIVRGDVWSPHYEQCNYFSEDSLCHLLRTAGFSVQRSGTVDQNSQYLFAEALPAHGAVRVEPTKHHSNQAIENFATIASLKVASWSERLERWSRARKRVFLWGSGGKATTLLSIVPEAAYIKAVVDINPNRQGQFTPCSAKEVISIEELDRRNPDIVLISNPAYRQEIATELVSRGIACELHVV